MTKSMCAGDVVGRFTLLQRLGQGAMGSVWLARDNGPAKREVALKFVPLSGSGLLKKRLEDEARIMASLYYQANLVMFHDAFEHGDDFVLVLEHLPGYTLGALIRAHRPNGLPWGCIRIVAEGILEALAHTHRYGVIHRDLKPENIRIFNPLSHPREIRVRDIKVLDFGLAWIHDPLDPGHSNEFSGTPSYMSPEQFDGGQQDFATDLYSFGVVLYEMITGTGPFECGLATREELFRDLSRRHFVETPTPMNKNRPEVPPVLQEVLNHTLAKSPRERPQGAEALRDNLIPLLNALSVIYPDGLTGLACEGLTTGSFQASITTNPTQGMGISSCPTHPMED